MVQVSRESGPFDPITTAPRAAPPPPRTCCYYTRSAKWRKRGGRLTNANNIKQFPMKDLGRHWDQHRNRKQDRLKSTIASGSETMIAELFTQVEEGEKRLGRITHDCYGAVAIAQLPNVALIHSNGSGGPNTAHLEGSWLSFTKSLLVESQLKAGQRAESRIEPGLESKAGPGPKLRTGLGSKTSVMDGKMGMGLQLKV
ncbi:hypothetical protein EVAR_75731_1 [Eumeta japonica]|uniref:Uncharacterized protein n=1 Tax=Eumeta variegata TaxID=151549 RepID=A0A4C2A776_EUMVA|nr:hypothetical protein EVAR_75731_1 [Eumeta japonica]